MSGPGYQGPADYDGILCPSCKSTNLTKSRTSHTLVGYSGGPENDGNHWETLATCNDCGANFTKHWVPRSKNAWYTIDRYVVMGKATCCGNGYWRACACGGWQRHLASGKGVRIGRDKNGRHVPGQPMGWKCQGCNQLFPDDRWGDEFLYEAGVIDPPNLIDSLNPPPAP